MKKLLAFSVCIGLMVLFLPIKSGFNINYADQKFWQLPDLYADFSFPLIKTDEEINEEKNAIKNGLYPFFVLDTSSISSYSDRFKAYVSEIKNLPESEFIRSDEVLFGQTGYILINELLSKGIISEAEPDLKINLITGNEITVRKTDSFFTIPSARAYLFDYLTNTKLNNPEILVPFLETFIRPNVALDSAMTAVALQDQLDQIIPYKGVIEKGALIVSKGEPIKGDVLLRLDSLKNYYSNQQLSKRQIVHTIVGFVLLSLIVLSIFYTYLHRLYPEIIQNTAQLGFILLWFPLYAALLYYATAINDWSPYIIPFAIVPIIIKNFFNSRLAFFTHIVNLILCSFIIAPGFEFSFSQIIAGTLVIIVIDDSYDWNIYLKSILFIFSGYALSYLGLNLLKGNSFIDLDFAYFKWIAINSFFTLLAFPLIPIMEKIFGFVAGGRLAELSDLNHPLLVKLATNAPGTYQHSIQVSLLAEAAARKIGANSFLVKVGALYHDIGKMINPSFFIENQESGIDSPHASLSPAESAKAITNHVAEGVKLAQEYGLPGIIIDFIKSHHGTSTVYFFYHKQKKSGSTPIDLSEFSYPGPLPITKEQSILMLADSVEAASRTLSDTSKGAISNFIHNIVTEKIKEGQLNESILSFSEIAQISSVFEENLKSVYHQRIAYPARS
jgi:cyclic-di-AMP phosphodiesterase PgpH